MPWTAVPMPAPQAVFDTLLSPVYGSVAQPLSKLAASNRHKTDFCIIFLLYYLLKCIITINIFLAKSKSEFF